MVTVFGPARIRFFTVSIPVYITETYALKSLNKYSELDELSHSFGSEDTELSRIQIFIVGSFFFHHDKILEHEITNLWLL